MIKAGSYFLIDDGRDGVDGRPSTPIVWITNVGVSPESGLPRIELKYATGWYGLVTDFDAEESTTHDDNELAVLDTPDGQMTFVWAAPIASFPAEVAGALVMSLQEFDPELAEKVAALSSMVDVQKAVYDACCAEYPS